MAVEGDNGSRGAMGSAIGIGSLVAGVISFALNKSVVWVIVHVFLSWIYVFYACCARGDEIAEIRHGSAESDR